MGQNRFVCGLLFLLAWVTVVNTNSTVPTCSICQAIQKPNLGHVKLLFEDLFTHNNEYSNLVFPHEDQLATIDLCLETVIPKSRRKKIERNCFIERIVYNHEQAIMLKSQVKPGSLDIYYFNDLAFNLTAH